MNIDQDSDITVASIAKVRDDGSKSDGEGLEELDIQDEEISEEITEEIAEEIVEKDDTSEEE